MKSNENLSVAVVVPFYNRSKFLKRLLDSIAIQTHPAEKVYIIDNGSNLTETLNAWQIISEHDLLNKCIFTSSLGRGNANYARNLGYELATTKYVAFLDSDDWWEKNHLKISIDCLRKSEKAAVYSGANTHFKNSMFTNKSVDISNYNDPFSLIMSPKGYLAQTSSFIINKEKLNGNLKWDEHLTRHQDFDFFATIYYYSLGWCYSPSVNVNIDWDSGGTIEKEFHLKSKIDFYKKWSGKIPTNIKKHYLLNMLRYTVGTNADLSIIMFYKNEITQNNYFNDMIYRLKANKLYILYYNELRDFISRLGIENQLRQVKKYLLK